MKDELKLFAGKVAIVTVAVILVMYITQFGIDGASMLRTF
jgi:hypothetical protein